MGGKLQMVSVPPPITRNTGILRSKFQLPSHQKAWTPPRQMPQDGC